jgi:PAS domain S-box-containing protein
VADRKLIEAAQMGAPQMSKKKPTYEELEKRVRELEKAETERKRAMEALRDSEERLRMALKGGNLGTWDWDTKTGKVIRDQGWADMLGYSLEKAQQPTLSNQLIHPEDKEREIKLSAAHQKGKLTFEESEYRIRKKDGEYIWVHSRGQVVEKDEDGNPTRFSGTIMNITERRQAEEKLRKSEEIYRVISGLVTSFAYSIFVESTKKFRPEWVSGKYHKITGYTLEEVATGGGWESIVYPEDIPVVKARRARLLSGESDTSEFRIVTKKGKICWLRDYAVSFWDDNHHRIVQITGAAQDITKRKQAEEALRESEEKYRLILENSSSAIQHIDTEGKFVLMNRVGIKYLGLEAKDVIGKSIYDIFPETADFHMQRFTEIMKAGKGDKFEDSFEVSSGKHWFLSDIQPVIDDSGNIRGVQIIGDDITERKQAEEKLRESEERFRSLAENISDCIWEGDENDIITYVSPNVKDVLGYEPDEMIGKRGYDFMPPEEREYRKKKDKETLKSRKPFKGVENKNYHKDGRAIEVESSGVPVFDTKGNFRGYRGIDRDITERKQAEEKLRESENRLTSIYNTVGDVLFYLAVEGEGLYRFISINSAFEKATGLSRESVEGSLVNEIIPEPSLTMVLGKYRQAIEENNIVRWEETSEYPAGRLVGLVTIAPIFDDDSKCTHLVGSVQDITEHKQLEEERTKTAKLESIGVLAGGIAHDFNNLLGSVMNNIWICKKEGSNEALGDVEKAIFKARDLTQQLLTFSKGGAPVKKVTSLPGLIKEATGFALRGSNVECRHYFSEDLWSCEIDKGQINQVIHNVLINADQAMPNGGVVNVRAANITIGLQDSLPLDEGHYVKISIKDQGYGIPEEHLLQIFDPYFTTKQKGSGLGLTTSYSIINKHRGFISAESEVQIGTTFHIYLPASFSEIKKIEQVVEDVPYISGRILVLDDEKLLRDSLRVALTSLGNKVRTTSNGTEAIKLYKKAMKSGQPFDVVILDLTIPGGMGGKETVKKLLEIDPKVKAIVTSGYSNDLVLSEYKEYGFVGEVSKPYQMNELQETLQSLLKEKSG